MGEPMDHTTLTLLAMLFGAIGLGFLTYARKQRDGLSLIIGVVLCTLPYFIANPYILVAVGTALVAFPVVVRR